MMSDKQKNTPLTRDEQHKIQAKIRAWKTKFSWDKLVQALKSDLGIEITRQALTTYDGIYTDYVNKKKELKGVTPEIVKKITMSDVDLTKKIDELKEELSVKSEIIEKQYALIKLMLANANEIPNYDVRCLTKLRDD